MSTGLYVSDGVLLAAVKQVASVVLGGGQLLIVGRVL